TRGRVKVFTTDPPRPSSDLLQKVVRPEKKEHRGGRLWDIKRRTYCTGELGDGDRMSLSTPCWSVRCLGHSGWR
ncbi:hypothetical protein GBAR_LOCUS5600, partial [Geodia barretti]